MRRYENLATSRNETKKETEILKKLYIYIYKIAYGTN